jgi:arsenate reductase (thioredoxin)
VEGFMVPHTVLFLCTGNSARSVMAEALLNAHGQGRWRALSAGSHPRGTVHPLALQTLESAQVPTVGLRSKSWNEFAGPGAPTLDFVFTVCGNAAAETCPVWPGHPATAHWGLDDPAAVEGTPEQKQRAFQEAFEILEGRVKRFVALPIENLDAAALRKALQEIGHGA